ncbi:hypothetical protein MLD38_017607 [Melastoma candidum]|uniref:Uncharacterized protein n=1 Tax=Melastoma candidum TaxID=119954 RepID=A0ACB9QSH2_9MYRT|nr:hypothetical protein MLD38_017607 [Melastoma candidum]
MASLQVLLLSNNMLSGEIPASFGGSGLQILWLNDQEGGGMSGGIDVVASMVSLTSLWLQGNSFSGKIPANIGDLVALEDLNLNGNKLVGLVPDSLTSMSLDSLDLNNNYFMGPMPKFKAVKSTCASNPFCLPTPGSSCSPEVMALIDFLDGMDYPVRLVSSWQGVQLQSNYLSGTIPINWTSLRSLTYLDLSNNNISYPLPKFSSSVKLVLNGNPLLGSNQSATPLTPAGTPSSLSGGSSSTLTPAGTPSSLSGGSSSTSSGGSSGSPSTTVSGSISGDSSSLGSSSPTSSNLKHPKLVWLAIIAPATCLVILLCLAIPLYFYCIKKKNTSPASRSLVVYPGDPSDSDNVVKIAVASNAQGSTSMNGNGSGSWNSSGFGNESHVVEAGNLIISVQVLRNVTKNFALQNELGRGGFGVVYKGELDDGTKIAVKRMEAGVISNKALDEFQAEIAVLSKVRHRHLVSLLGYSIEGYERILVYEYMPKGALSKHLFHWKSLNLEPLTWKRRLNIALDVARGMEYLHSLAHQSFIHRDLKSSNILLADDYRAKVSDFGLVKLAPDGEKSVVTRLAGTFGYLAPEYAVTGKITTKADVFSYGVVLMELLTGLMALDEERPEESQYLVGYFWNIKSDREKLMATIDPVLDRKDETFESILVIAELAGHCTAREPSQRPDMSHVVNVLAPLVEKWRPFEDDAEEYSGIDYSMPLNQMVKDWQEAEGRMRVSWTWRTARGASRLGLPGSRSRSLRPMPGKHGGIS